MNDRWRDRLGQVLREGVHRREVLAGLGLALPVAASLSRFPVEESEAKNRNKQKRKRRRNTKQQRRKAKVSLKVMSRNIYLGADLAPLFTVTTLPELIAAGTALFATVQETDFPARAKLLAAEIIKEEPDIVGLQEVSYWRTQTPSDGNPTPNAEDVVYDFLTTLLDELVTQGGQYEAVVSVNNFDGEIPIQGTSGLIDLRLTDRDVILARSGTSRNSVAISNATSGNFATNAVIPNPVLGDITILRGWTAVDVKRKHVTTRVVNTHLEAIAPPIQEAQGAELLAGPLQTDLPTVLLGDLNSGAYGGGTPGQTQTPTYQNMLDAGFVDAWPNGRAQGESYTCCQAEDLMNEDSLLSERIDFVLTRGSITAKDAERLGADSDVRTPSGLWTSDHAGVSAHLRVKR